ncbi:MAG: 30S ribosomal protein S18 [Candidatus Omnitrophota bacterium]
MEQRRNSFSKTGSGSGSRSRSRDEKKPFRKDGEGSFGGGGNRRSSGIRQARFSIPKGTDINYKNIAFLQKCLTERGKVFSRRMTNANAKEQRLLAEAVKLARFLGLLPVGSSKRK